MLTQPRHRKSWKFLIISFSVLCSLFYISMIEPNWIDVRQVSLTLPHLDRAFDGYKIVQLTDIHADRWMNRDRLSRIIRIANQQNPDLVALTGDYITKAAPIFAPTLDVLEQLTPKDGTIAVLGNHDHWSNPRLLTQIMSQAGVTLLHNQVESIQRGNAYLNIGGVGDVMAGQARLPWLLTQMPTQGAGILLAHEPDFVDEVVSISDRFDLQLSGHSHGGQIRLPFLNVRRITPNLGKKYPNGLYHVGNMLQYTSRGIGLAGSIRVRLNCRPEVTVLTLHSPAAADS
jgi:uncharacterized protein